MASARKSSRRSLPMLLNNGLQQSTRSHVKNESSFGLTDDLDLYYIRQIASHMKVRSQNALWSIHGSFQSCNMPCRPCTKKEKKNQNLLICAPTRFRQIFLLSL